MIAIPFDVNNDTLRRTFFDQMFINCIDDLAEDAQPLWGTMTAQQMLEHLIWAFECSTGVVNATCRTPENLLDRTKVFLFDNRQTPRNFKNPLLGDTPPPLRFASFAEAKDALQTELARFIDHFREQPDAIHVHPIFGPIGAGEWQRSHFKHCYHHLLQFGVIGEK
jgi:oxepin-CoA hydrolase / 3-oxo-5,6-dehydrosuberyl-CoA semialdehyde dehydrogenase